MNIPKTRKPYLTLQGGHHVAVKYRMLLELVMRNLETSSSPSNLMTDM